ncbi:GNAT family N-acetyltransferase [Spongiactinospora sp. 9N601]|uniref:GNAT family N-acetyltransferase n=1 Tax=Spongiactinospora sp. 9N601 TaxID=3375149 RepID=UPI0037B049B6
MAGLVVRRHSRNDARAVRAVVSLIHRGACVREIAGGDPSAGDAEFIGHFDRYVANQGFELVVAYEDGEPVGQAWGWPLDERSGATWWKGLVCPPEPGFAREDGHRTFALSALMVRRAWTRRGIARALHDELLLSRPETRATLLVRPGNIAACSAYAKWGWTRRATLRPDALSAPTMDVLTLDLTPP